MEETDEEEEQGSSRERQGHAAAAPPHLCRRAGPVDELLKTSAAAALAVEGRKRERGAVYELDGVRSERASAGWLMMDASVGGLLMVPAAVFIMRKLPPSLRARSRSSRARVDIWSLNTFFLNTTYRSAKFVDHSRRLARCIRI